jgi:hypothetical protein
MLAAVPLLLLPVLAYNIAALLVSDAGFRTLDAADRLGAALFSVPRRLERPGPSAPRTCWFSWPSRCCL